MSKRDPFGLYIYCVTSHGFGLGEEHRHAVNRRFRAFPQGSGTHIFLRPADRLLAQEALRRGFDVRPVESDQAVLASGLDFVLTFEHGPHRLRRLHRAARRAGIPTETHWHPLSIP